MPGARVARLYEGVSVETRIRIDGVTIDNSIERAYTYSTEYTGLLISYHCINHGQNSRVVKALRLAYGDVGLNLYNSHDFNIKRKSPQKCVQRANSRANAMLKDVNRALSIQNRALSTW